MQLFERTDEMLGRVNLDKALELSPMKCHYYTNNNIRRNGRHCVDCFADSAVLVIGDFAPLCVKVDEWFAGEFHKETR